MVCIAEEQVLQIYYSVLVLYMGLPHSALICISVISRTIITTPSLHIFGNSECGFQVLCNSESGKCSPVNGSLH
jgi:hypothetical protein